MISVGRQPQRQVAADSKSPTIERMFSYKSRLTHSETTCEAR